MIRTNIVFAAAEAKGGEVTGERAYVGAVENLAPPQTSGATSTESASPEELERIELEGRVAAAIAEIREKPPVHERPEPWTVGVNELVLELQPLRKEQVQERVEKWLDILQLQLRQRIRIDIAVAEAVDSAERQALADQASTQHRTIASIVERLKAALVELQRRGGDVSEYRAYVNHATGQKLDLTNLAVLKAQVSAWLRSPNGGLSIANMVLKCGGILLAFWLVARLIGMLTKAAVHRVPNVSNLFREFIVNSSRRTVMAIGLIVAVSSFGVNITPLIAAIGAAGLVIGLALQGTLSNFASGILIMVTRPYDVGDVVSAGGVTGKVGSMNLVSTKILTFDNQLSLVPNNQVWNGVITNVTTLGTRRVDMVFGIGYSDDIGKAKQVIEEIITSHPLVLDDPAPVVRVHELADSSVNFVVRPWTKTPDYWNVYWDVTRDLKLRFDQEGISIPFPQRDLHISDPVGLQMAEQNGPTRAAKSGEATAGAVLGDRLLVREPGPAEDDQEA